MAHFGKPEIPRSHPVLLDIHVRGYYYEYDIVFLKHEQYCWINWRLIKIFSLFRVVSTHS